MTKFYRDWGKRFRALALALALVAVAPVAGCASLASLSGQQELAVADEKALMAAELAFDGALSAIQAADAAGLITRENAPAIRNALHEARNSILVARAAYDANEQAEAAIATNNAVGAVAILAGLLVDLGIIERG